MKIVNDCINLAFWEAMQTPGPMLELGSIPADCCVGEAVVKLLNDFEQVATKVYASDGGALESDAVACMKAIAYRQARIWMFG
jgi:hypothetical protein